MRRYPLRTELVYTTLERVGNTEGPVDRVPEVDLDPFARQALGMVPVAFILQAGKYIDRIRCHQREPARRVGAGQYPDTGTADCAGGNPRTGNGRRLLNSKVTVRK